MTILRGGMIGSLGGAGGSSSDSPQLDLSNGIGSYTQSFSGVTTLSITHGLGTESVVVEFKDSSKNLLVPNNWQVINPNRIDVDFGSSTVGDVVVLGIIASGLAPVTGGVTLLEGMSGIIDVDSPNQSILISTSGQVLQLNAIFTPASGAVLQQAVSDINTLSGLLGSSNLLKSVHDFSPLSGYEFVINHNLGTLDFSFTMWATDQIPQMIMTPSNVYPSGLNHAVISLDVPISGRVVFIG